MISSAWGHDSQAAGGSFEEHTGQMKEQTKAKTWKGPFAGDLIGPVVIYLCHVTSRHSQEQLQAHSLGLQMKHT